MDVPQRTKAENIKLFVAVALLAAYVVGTIVLVVWLPKQVFQLMLSMVESLH